MAKNDFQYCGWNSYTLQCGMWLWDHDSEFTKWPTLQRDTWLWDDMSLNSPKRPPYWNYTSGLDFDHITAVDMSFCIPVCEIFIQIGPHSAGKNDVMSISKMANLRHLGFYGFNNAYFKKPMYDFL